MANCLEIFIASAEHFLCMILYLLSTKPFHMVATGCRLHRGSYSILHSVLTMVATEQLSPSLTLRFQSATSHLGSKQSAKVRLTYQPKHRMLTYY